MCTSVANLHRRYGIYGHVKCISPLKGALTLNTPDFTALNVQKKSKRNNKQKIIQAKCCETNFLGKREPLIIINQVNSHWKHFGSVLTHLYSGTIFHIEFKTFYELFKIIERIKNTTCCTKTTTIQTHHNALRPCDTVTLTLWERDNITVNKSDQCICKNVYRGSVCLGILPQWASGQQLPGTGRLTSVVPESQLMLGSRHRFISHTAKKEMDIQLLP